MRTGRAPKPVRISEPSKGPQRNCITAKGCREATPPQIGREANPPPCNLPQQIGQTGDERDAVHQSVSVTR